MQIPRERRDRHVTAKRMHVIVRQQAPIKMSAQIADDASGRSFEPPALPKPRPGRYPKRLRKLLRAKSGAKVRNQLLDLPAGTRVRKVSGGAVELGKKR